MLLMGRNRSELILSRALSRRYLGNAIGLPMPEEGTMSAVPGEVLALFWYLRETSAAAARFVFWTVLERPDHGLAAVALRRKRGQQTADRYAVADGGSVDSRWSSTA
jgi:hypothetical protein